VTSSFEITHQSIGQPNQEFWESKEKFLKVYEKKLPIDLPPKSVFFEKIPTLKKGKFGKVAIIIPTKGKVEMLIDCINSFLENCNSDLFDIFIADTGSNVNEKGSINNYIQNKKNIFLIEYYYYNFAKINNDVVNNHISSEYEFLLFCNNDIKILNDVISGMVRTFNEKNNVGTIGSRLHFKDNKVQHGGIISGIDKNNSFQVSHIGLSNYYFIDMKLKEVVGSTGALLMIRKNVFEKINGFNEKYISCFEDVELNFECVRIGLTNYVDGRLAAYHYESQTRNDDGEKLSKLMKDYREILLPYVSINLDKLKKYLIRF
jgi:GT2 family glycosyltransferase